MMTGVLEWSEILWVLFKVGDITEIPSWFTEHTTPLIVTLKVSQMQATFS